MASRSSGFSRSGLMIRDRNLSGTLPAAIRFAAWLLPRHRESWAEAMLNEAAYITSRRAALRWAFGCTCAAFRERVTHELEKTLMRRRMLRILVGLTASLALVTVGIYVTAKPYQRERIWITVRQALQSDQAPRADQGRPSPD